MTGATLPKMADCSKCMEFKEVVWRATADGMQAVCAKCRKAKS